MSKECKKLVETSEIENPGKETYAVEPFDGMPQIIKKKIFNSPVASILFVARHVIIKRKIIGFFKAEEYRQCDIAMIHTEEAHRRQGHAEDLIKELQKISDVVRTDYFTSTTAGKKLMKKCGFKKVEDWLVWSKDKKRLKKIQTVLRR